FALSKARDDVVEDQTLTKPLSFIVEKKECAVFAAIEMRNSERAAQVAAKLVAFEDLASKSKVVACVKFVVPYKFENSAVELIAAALGSGVEKRSSTVVFSGVGALLDGKLLQGIDGSLDESTTLVLLRNVDAVEQEGGGGAANSADHIAVDDL